jgi:hypothetical protein
MEGPLERSGFGNEASTKMDLKETGREDVLWIDLDCDIDE